MISSTFRIMWLRLWRDRGAFSLAFLLPGVIFAVFAAIFSTASGGELDLRVALVSDGSEAGVALADDILDRAAFDIESDANWTDADVREAVRLGQYDVGLLVTGFTHDNSPPFTIYGDPSRAVATTVLKGQLRQILAEQNGSPQVEHFTEISAVATGNGGQSDQSVTYYIGATAILFLLFSAMQAANLSIEERRNGINDRLMLGGRGTMARMIGKLAFLTFIGFLQAFIIVGVAYFAFDVPVLDHLPGVTLACFGTALLSASIALLVASLCSSAPQMHAVSTFLVLLFSAIGGSMVPRFMMPGWLQDIGQFTPNHYAIEAFYGILARGQSVASLWLVWGVLFGGAALCLLSAAFISHRLQRG